MRAFTVVIACVVALAAAVPENMMETRITRRQCVRDLVVRIDDCIISLTLLLNFSFALKAAVTGRLAVQTVAVTKIRGNLNTSLENCSNYWRWPEILG